MNLKDVIQNNIVYSIWASSGISDYVTCDIKFKLLDNVQNITNLFIKLNVANVIVDNIRYIQVINSLKYTSNIKTPYLINVDVSLYDIPHINKSNILKALK